MCIKWLNLHPVDLKDTDREELAKKSQPIIFKSVGMRIKEWEYHGNEQITKRDIQEVDDQDIDIETVASYLDIFGRLFW